MRRDADSPLLCDESFSQPLCPGVHAHQTPAACEILMARDQFSVLS
jgi:hypothetical protein